MSEQLSFIAPPMPPPAVMAKQEIRRATEAAERARKLDEKEATKAAEAACIKANEAQFESFWLAFPKRPLNPKAPAKLSWARALRGNANNPPATVAEIMEGLARYPFSTEPKMRPMAATWLNQRRFRDVEPDPSADAWGLTEWHATITSDGTLSAAMYDPDDLRPILIATGWEPSWRGSLDVLSAWMRDGYVPDSVAKVIASAVAEFGARGNLAAFDKRVRYRAERISL